MGQPKPLKIAHGRRHEYLKRVVILSENKPKIPTLIPDFKLSRKLTINFEKENFQQKKSVFKIDIIDEISDMKNISYSKNL
jgi:hypothetical protein